MDGRLRRSAGSGILGVALLLIGFLALAIGASTTTSPLVQVVGAAGVFAGVPLVIGSLVAMAVVLLRSEKRQTGSTK